MPVIVYFYLIFILIIIYCDDDFKFTVDNHKKLVTRKVKADEISQKKTY